MQTLYTKIAHVDTLNFCFVLYIQGCCYDTSSSIPLAWCYYADTSYQDLYFFGHGHGNLTISKIRGGRTWMTIYKTTKVQLLETNSCMTGTASFNTSKFPVVP